MRVGEDAKFLERLVELRKQYDLYPWAEVMFATVPAATAEGAVPTPALGMQLTEDFLVSEFTGKGFGNGAHNANVSFDVLIRKRIGPNPVGQAKRSFNARAIFGTESGGWHRLGAGMLLLAGTEVLFDVTTKNAISGAGVTGRFWIIARGYKLRPKGSVTPPQRTIEELSGQYILDPYTEGARIAVPNSLTAGGYVKHKFLESFAITHISLHPTPLGGGVGYLDQVKISPEIKMMSDFANVLPLAGDSSTLDTAWDFPLPITVKAGSEWELEAKAEAVAPGGVYDFDFVFHGYRLKPRATK